MHRSIMATEIVDAASRLPCRGASRCSQAEEGTHFEPGNDRHFKSRSIVILQQRDLLRSIDEFKSSRHNFLLSSIPSSQAHRFSRLFETIAMALPVVRTAVECSDFYQTVWPYANQLSALPQIYFESIAHPAALRQIYLDTNPLVTAFAFSLFLTPIFLLVSELNKNYSQVDRVWSILPTVYNAHYVVYAHMMGMETKRLDTVLVASLLWSVSFPVHAPNTRILKTHRSVLPTTTHGKEDTILVARIIDGRSCAKRFPHRCSLSLMSSSFRWLNQSSYGRSRHQHTSSS
jgi:hypothetical protein